MSASSAFVADLAVNLLPQLPIILIMVGLWRGSIKKEAVKQVTEALLQARIEVLEKSDEKQDAHIQKLYEKISEL